MSLHPGQNHGQTSQTAEQLATSSPPQLTPPAPGKTAVPTAESASHPEPATPSAPRSSLRKRIVLGIVGIAVVGAAAVFDIPMIVLAFTTISTDDAYVNGHVTFVAARVPGQVSRVLVDDNMRVRKGDLLLQLDKEPNQVQVDVAKAKVETAKAQLRSAQAEAQALAGKARSTRFFLEHAIEDVHNNVALLRAKVATLETYLAQRARAKSDFDRATAIMKTPGAISQQELDLRLQDYLVAKAQVKQGLEAVYQVRVALGLPISPVQGDITRRRGFGKSWR